MNFQFKFVRFKLIKLKISKNLHRQNHIDRQFLLTTRHFSLYHFFKLFPLPFTLLWLKIDKQSYHVHIYIYIRVHVCFSYHRRANHPVSVIASTIPRFSARARPTACTYFLRPRSVPCGSLAYVSLSQSLLDVVAQARAREKREGREGGLSYMKYRPHSISAADTL